MAGKDGKFERELLTGDYLIFIKAYSAKKQKYYNLILPASITKEKSFYKFHGKKNGKKPDNLLLDNLAPGANYFLAKFVLIIYLEDELNKMLDKM